MGPTSHAVQSAVLETEVKGQEHSPPRDDHRGSQFDTGICRLGERNQAPGGSPGSGGFRLDPVFRVPSLSYAKGACLSG